MVYYWDYLLVGLMVDLKVDMMACWRVAQKVLQLVGWLVN